MRSVLLTMTSRIIFPFAMLFSLHLLLRGHDLPGGGFIAGLVTSATIALKYIAFDVQWTNKRLPFTAAGLVVAGLSLALATGVGSFWFGHPFLTSAILRWELPLIGEIKFVTTLFFDVGVYLTVVGVMLCIFQYLGEYRRERRWS